MAINKSLFVLLAIVFGCASAVDDASAWTSISPGAGGAATAIDADPASGIVLAGSDVGGMRYSNDSATTWHNVSRGIIQRDGYSSAKNFQAVKIFTVGETRLAVATTTAGVIYWSYITDNYRETFWEVLFDSQTILGWGKEKIPFGAIAVGPISVFGNSRKIFVGVGNINALARNDALQDIPAGKAGTVMVFNAIEEGEEAVTITPYAKAKVPCSASCQVSDLDSPYVVRAPDLADVLVSTTEGIYKLTDRGANSRGKGQFDVEDKTGDLPTGTPFLSIAGHNGDHNGDEENVAVLLDEDSTDATVGGVYLTTDFSSDAPAWSSRNGNLPFSEGVGKLKRSRTNPSEVVVSGDAGTWTNKGVYFNGDITNSTSTWVELINASVPSTLDGWTRYSNNNDQIKEIAIKDDADGIGEVYIGGFSGFIFRGVREDARDSDTLYVCDNELNDDNNAPIFCFSQIYSTRYQDTSSGIFYYKSRGIPLAVPSAEVYINPDDPNQIYSLYVDNIFFVSPDRGENFSRPVYKSGMGTGVVFNGSFTSYVSYVRGSSDFDAATDGGIFESTNNGEIFEPLILTSSSTDPATSNLFPDNPVISAFTKFDGYFVCAVWGNGVYKSDNATVWTFMGLANKNVNKFVVAKINGSDVLLASYNTGDGSDLLKYYDETTDPSNPSWENIPRVYVDGADEKYIQSVKNFRNVNGYLVVTEDDNEGYYLTIPATVDDFSTKTWTKLGKEFSDIAYDSNTNKYYIATATAGLYKATDFTDIANIYTGWKPMTNFGLGGTKTFKYISVFPNGLDPDVYVGANGAWGFFRR